MAEGVEWALHSCLLLAWAGPDPVPAAKLAAYHQLPPAYLNKQLQALARAGIVSSQPGAKGGFQLARRPERVTLMDVVAAIEGPEEAFRCLEIRQRVPVGRPAPRFRSPCSIAAAMRKAELAWRRSLSEQTLADVIGAAARNAPDGPRRVRSWFRDARS